MSAYDDYLENVAKKTTEVARQFDPRVQPWDQLGVADQATLKTYVRTLHCVMKAMQFFPLPDPEDR